MRGSDRTQRPHRLRGKWLALALALAVNVLFIGVLVFSVTWQNRRPEAVTAELYAPPDKNLPPTVVAAKPQPPEPKPAPKPVPEPRIEKPDPHAADIALKAKAEAEKQEEQKRQLERQQREIAAMRAQAEREVQARVQTEQELQLRAQAEAEAKSRNQQQADSAARNRLQSEWIDRIRSKIRGNVILPPDLAGNPEAVFEVVQLPTGEIIDVQLRKSSGMHAYDDAVQRAILKSSPLPRPDRTELFQRALTLRFRPVD